MDKEKELKNSKRLIYAEVAIFVISLISFFALTLVAGLAPLEDWLRVTLVGVSLVVLFAGIFVCTHIDADSSIYECRHCQARFTPTIGAYLIGMHTPTKRHLKCPECGKRSWCKRRLTH